MPSSLCFAMDFRGHTTTQFTAVPCQFCLNQVIAAYSPDSISLLTVCCLYLGTPPQSWVAQMHVLLFLVNQPDVAGKCDHPFSLMWLEVVIIPSVGQYHHCWLLILPDGSTIQPNTSSARAITDGGSEYPYSFHHDTLFPASSE